MVDMTTAQIDREKEEANTWLMRGAIVAAGGGGLLIFAFILVPGILSMFSGVGLFIGIPLIAVSGFLSFCAAVLFPITLIAGIGMMAYNGKRLYDLSHTRPTREESGFENHDEHQVAAELAGEGIDGIQQRRAIARYQELAAGCPVHSPEQARHIRTAQLICRLRERAITPDGRINTSCDEYHQATRLARTVPY